MSKRKICSKCLTKTFKGWVEISNETHMATTVNELYLLTCLHIPAMKDLMINTVSAVVYQSTEIQSHIIIVNTFSINNQKKHTHNSLMTFIGSKQSLVPPKNYGSFFSSVSLSKHTFFYFLSRFRKFTLFKSTATEYFNTDEKSPVKNPPHFLFFFG